LKQELYGLLDMICMPFLEGISLCYHE
jgi:hypothetical protein